MAEEAGVMRPEGAQGLDAIVVGSAMIDVIAVIDPENIERMSMRNEGAAYLLLEQGRKVPASSITPHIGGGGCNVSVSLARRGWRTRAATKVGDDMNADAIRAHLQRNGVETDFIFTEEGGATGVAVMIAAHEKNAAIFVHRGANESFLSSDAQKLNFGPDAPQDPPQGAARLFYISPLSSASADAFPALVEQARWLGAFVASNPGIRQLTSRSEAFFGAMGNLDLLSVNAKEAAALAPGLIARGARDGAGQAGALAPDAPEFFRRGLSFGGFDLGLPAFFNGLHESGVRWATLTDGAEGGYLSGPLDGADKPNGVLYCPAAPAEISGTAGAGDAYCSTLASELARGAQPSEAMLRAALNAAGVVTQVNTTDGLMSAEALDAAIKTTRVSVRRLV